MPELTAQELTDIQTSWLRNKILDYGTRMSIIYFKSKSKVNPDAKKIAKYLATFTIK